MPQHNIYFYKVTICKVTKYKPNIPLTFTLNGCKNNKRKEHSGAAQQQIGTQRR